MTRTGPAWVNVGAEHAVTSASAGVCLAHRLSGYTLIERNPHFSPLSEPSERGFCLDLSQNPSPDFGEGFSRAL